MQQRRRRRLVLGAVVILLAGAGAGYLLVGHKLDRESLSYSLATSVIGAHVRPGLVADCEHSRGTQWTCSMESAARGDGGIVYLLRTHGDCWSARLSANFSGFRLPGHAKGCVGVLDQLRVDDRLDVGGSDHGFF